MALRSCTFRQRDVKCALKAALDAGMEVASFEIGKDGKIIVKAARLPTVADAAANGPNPWDKVLNENA